ncbi:Uncharacterised protein [Enterobacter asburiae]|nr:Uncharacterised protein [Enterobacter asburiae]
MKKITHGLQMEKKLVKKSFLNIQAFHHKVK